MWMKCFFMIISNESIILQMRTKKEMNRKTSWSVVYCLFLFSSSAIKLNSSIHLFRKYQIDVDLNIECNTSKRKYTKHSLYSVYIKADKTNRRDKIWLDNTWLDVWIKKILEEDQRLFFRIEETFNLHWHWELNIRLILLDKGLQVMWREWYRLAF